MNIRVLSDLHLEFGGMDPGEGDVLVLAGDIVVIDDIRLGNPQGKYFLKFLKRCVKNYNKVFYVLGNHEYYFSNKDEAITTLKERIPNEIVILNNNSEFYEGVHFVGATLWTDFNNDRENQLKAESTMNDYYTIRTGEVGMPLMATDVLKDHNNTIEWFNQAINTLNGPVVVVTHHAPSLESLKGDYVENDLKHSYATDLTDLIHKNPGIVLWAHGHIHASNDYMIGDCRVVSNPRGYAGQQENPDFDPLFEVTVNAETHSNKEVQPV